MRIRKRKVPLPLSLLSPVPLSDPHLFSRSPVMLHHHLADLTSSSHTPAPDLLHAKEKLFHHLGFGEGERKQEPSNDSSNTAATIGAPAASQNHDNVPLVVPPVSNEDLKPWSDRERVIPLKKRKTNFEQSVSSTNVVVEPGSTTTLATDSSKVGKDSTKIKDCGEPNNLCVIGVSHDDNSNNNSSTKKGTGSKRGNTIMEGSRCSRVNGRGWRCCQPTLVGYSLCEHHLGKGRMRSMTTVRGRPLASKKAPPPPPPRAGEMAVKKRDEIDHEDEVVKSMTGTVSSIGKRVKLGVVKARSLSSLLGQTTNNTSSNNIDGHIGLDVNNIHQASFNMHDQSNGLVKEEA